MTVIVSKETLMQQVVAGINHEAFQHETEGIFDVTAIRYALHGDRIPWEQVDIALDCVCPHIRQSRDFDMQRVDTLDEASWRHDPGIYIRYTYPGETGREPDHLLIDGAHRALRREKEGLSFMSFYIIEPRYAVRPAAGWTLNPFFEWGRQLVDGKLVERGK